MLFFTKEPDKPVIGGIDYADSSLNVSWTPTDAKNEPNIANPGQDFYVKYRKAGSTYFWFLFLSNK